MKFKIIRGGHSAGWKFRVDFRYRCYNPFILRWFSDIKTLRIELPNCSTYGFGKHPEMV